MTEARSGFVAVTSQDMQIPAFEEWLQEKLGLEKSDLNYQINSISNDFFIIEVKDLGSANQLVRIVNGASVSDTASPFLAAVINIDKFNDIFITVSQSIKAKTKETLLDLSEYQNVINAPLDNPGIGSSILLVAAVTCGVRAEIKQISFVKSGITKGMFLTSGIKTYFPKLKKIALNGNIVVNNKQFMDNIAKSKIKIITKDEDLDPFFKVPEVLDKNSYVIVFQKRPINPVNPNLVKLGNPQKNGRLHAPDIYQYEPCGFDITLPLNKFIVDFLKASWSDITSIKSFYHPLNSVFSILVRGCAPDSHLQKYTKYSRDVTRTTGNFISGASDIVQAQTEVFVKGFYAYPTHMEASDLNDNLSAIVIHGAFQDIDGYTIEFDRSLAISSSTGKLMILNDQIYFHEPAVS